MSLDQLRSFVAVAEEGGVVRAARRLHISQPPLTRKIKSLEAELGADLFERKPRGMQLTEQGRVFLPRARQVLDAVNEAVLAVTPDLEGAARSPQSDETSPPRRD